MLQAVHWVFTKKQKKTGDFQKKTGKNRKKLRKN